MSTDGDSSDCIFTFGKHKGRTFIDVYNNDLNYVNWIKSLEEPTGKLLEFCNFIKNHEMCRKATDLHPQGRPLGKDDQYIQQPPEKRQHTLPYSKVTSIHTNKVPLVTSHDPIYNGSINGATHLSEVHDGTSVNGFMKDGDKQLRIEVKNGLMTIRNNNDVLPPSSDFPPPMEYDLEDLKRIEMHTPVRTRITGYDSNVSSRKSNDIMDVNNKRPNLLINIPSNDGNVINSRKSELESPCMIVNKEEEENKRIELDGILALVIYSENEFYLEYCKTVKNTFSRWTCYIPLQVYEYLNGLGFESNSRLLGRERCITYKSDDYKLILKNLYKFVQDRHMLEPIPNFILRTFPEFNKFSKEYEMPSRTAQSIYGLQTPFGKSNVKDFSNYIGEELYRELKPFQYEGIQFGIMKNGRVLIGDEMGLGKTLQALGISAFYSIDWPLLIVCPSSLRFQWRDQCKRWLPHLIIHDDDICVIKTGKHKIQDNVKIVIISYDLLSKNEHFQDDYKIIICDESHYLKNRTAKRTKTIVPLLKNAKRVILLSGTPALNIPSELYEQLSCLMPCFSSNAVFVERYCEKRMNWYTKKWNMLDQNTHMNYIYSLRLKDNVLHELPPKIRTKIPIELPPAFIKSYKNSIELREKITNSKDFEEDFKSFQEIFKLTGEAKCKGICDYILYLLGNNIKFLVFAHHRFVMDAIEVILKDKKVNYIRIDGSTPQDKREKFVKRFQEKEECTVAILSLTACGTGLNLTASSTVVFAELFWVPGQMIQAEDRAHRLGTKHTVINIHYLIAENSVEETVWKVINRKWETITSTLNGETSNLALKEKINKNQNVTKIFLNKDTHDNSNIATQVH